MSKKKIAFVAAGGVVVIGVIIAATASGGGNKAMSSPPVVSDGPSSYKSFPYLPPFPTPDSPDSPIPSPVISKSRTVAFDGIYKVGSDGDLDPGRYTTTGPTEASVFPNCYYARLRNDSGDFSAIISNNNIQGRGSVTIKAGEYFEVSGHCTWVKQ